MRIWKLGSMVNMSNLTRGTFLAFVVGEHVKILNSRPQLRLPRTDPLRQFLYPRCQLAVVPIKHMAPRMWLHRRPPVYDARLNCAALYFAREDGEERERERKSEQGESVRAGDRDRNGASRLAIAPSQRSRYLVLSAINVIWLLSCQCLTIVLLRPLQWSWLGLHDRYCIPVL